MPVLILIPSLLLAVFGSTTSSSSSTRIHINPQATITTVSGNFTLDINVEDVADLSAFEFLLAWDPQLLDAINITEGTFLLPSGKTHWWYNINQSEGWLIANNYVASGFPDVSGSGTLATVKFHGVSIGGCTLELYNTKLVDSWVSVPTPPYLGDINGDLIVDNFDLVRLAQVYGAELGDPGFDPNADFNGDTVIDFFDLIYLNFNFGHSYQPGDQAKEPVVIIHEANDGYATIYPSPIKEDLNGDDTVDMNDMGIVAAAYGSYLGDPRWNPLCDLMKDSVIDDFDANMVGRMLGWSAGDPITPAPAEWKLSLTIDHLVRGIESHTVAILSDYIVFSNYTFNHLMAELIFDVTSSIDGFCNITIPRGLLNGAFHVELDDVAVPSILTWNGTHTWIYFTSTQLSHRVKIVGLTPGDVTEVPGETRPIVDIYDVVFISTHFEDPLRYIGVYLGPHFYS